MVAIMSYYINTTTLQNNIVTRRIIGKAKRFTLIIRYSPPCDLFLIISCQLQDHRPVAG